MKKTLSLLLVLAMVLSSFSFAFAAEAEKTPGEVLKDLGVLTGNAKGDLMLEDELSRQDMVVLLSRVLGQEDEAKAFKGEISFTDVNDSFYKPYIAWAEANELTNGVGEGKFGFGRAVTEQEVATLMLRALGYNDVEWEDVPAKAAELGLVAKDADLTVNAKRARMAEITLAALGTKMNGSEKTLAEKLGIELPKPAKFEVVNVKADNLKTMVIEFNKEIDEDTLNNIEVDVDYTLQLSEDKMSVAVIYDTVVEQSKKVELVIDGLKSIDGQEIAGYKEAIVVTDTAIPVLEDAKALNAKQIELKFSEPVNFDKQVFTTMNNVKVDGKNLVAKTSQDYLRNTVVLTTTAPFKAGTYKLEVSSIADFAKLKISSKEFTIEVVEDTEAPKMVEAKAKSAAIVEVTFDEAIDRLSDGTYGVFKVNGNTIPRSNVKEVANSAGTKFDLVLASKLDLSAVVEVKVAYKGQKDMAGNVVKDEQLFTFSVIDDVTLPEVSLAIGAGNKLTLTFSKPMLKTEGTIRVLDKNNKEIARKAVSAVGGNFEKNDTVLVLSGSDVNLVDTNVDNYTLNIKGMKDATIRMNLLPEQNIEFTTKDTKKPSVLNEYTVEAGKKADHSDDTITFYFSEAMNEETLTNLSNFIRQSDNKPFSIISGVKDPVVSLDKKSVTITYKNASALTINDKFKVYGVKDEAGNFADVKDNIVLASKEALKIVKVEAVALNKIVVQFTKEVVSVDPSVLMVKNGTSFSSEFISATISSDDATKVTFVTAKDLAANTTGYKVEAQNKDLISDLGGNHLDDNLVNNGVKDAIAPELDDVVAGNKITSKNDETANVFTLVFTEEVKATSADEFLKDLVVRKSDDERIAASNLEVVNAADLAEGKNMVVIRVKNSADLSSGNELIKVSFPVVNDIKDIAGNGLVEFSDQKSVTINVANMGVTGKAEEVTKGVAPTEGTKEVNTLTITGTAKAGSIVVVLNNNVNKIITVDEGETAAQIATKIVTAFVEDANYDVTAVDNVVTFTAKVAAADKNVTITLVDTVGEITGAAKEVTKGVAPTEGTKEVNTLTITGNAKIAGTLSVVFNDGAEVKKDVEVSEGETAAQIATKIATAFAEDANYDVTAVDNVVTFTAKVAAADKNVTITLSVK